MSFYNLSSNASSIKSLLNIGNTPMATRHSRLWLKLKWRKQKV